MSESDLEALKAHLLALDADAVEEPRLPIDVALQEASDLLVLLKEEPSVLARLVAVGFDTEVAAALGPAVGATRTAQSRWVVLRDRSKPEAQREREERGAALRSELLSAARWNLRDDRAALTTLSAISEGEGVADLVQDLADLAELIERERDAFARDTTFDVAASIELSRSLSDEIAAGASTTRLDGRGASARDLRDRAYTHLAGIVDEIREAGRHAFRKERGMQKHFTSRYLRRRRARVAAAAKAKAASPTA